MKLHDCNKKEITVKLEESKRKLLEGHVTTHTRWWGINDDVRFSVEHWRREVLWKQQWSPPAEGSVVMGRERVTQLQTGRLKEQGSPQTEKDDKMEMQETLHPIELEDQREM